MSVPSSAKAIEGSAEAKRLCALILESLSGIRTTQEAADEMSVSLPRYYQLETRGLQGMVLALEKRERGRPKEDEDRLKIAQESLVELKLDLARYQALYRTAQRAIGVQEVERKASAKTNKKTRKSRRKPRGQRIVSVLRDCPKESDPPSIPDLIPTQEEHANGPTQ